MEAPEIYWFRLIVLIISALCFTLYIKEKDLKVWLLGKNVVILHRFFAPQSSKSLAKRLIAWVVKSRKTQGNKLKNICQIN